MDLMNNTNFFLFGEIVKKNFFSKYKDSVLGILWSVLRPLLIVIVLTIIFSTIFKGSIENYPVYLLSGRCIFEFFVSATNVSMMAIKGNANILKKTTAPKYIFVLSGIASEFINFIISFLLLIFIMAVTRAPFHLETMLFSIIPIVSLLILLMGIGLIVSVSRVYYNDIQHLWSVISMIIMYSSAIFYPMDIIPEPYHQFLILNPLFWTIDQFRDFLTLGIFPDILNIINSFLLSIIILVIGIIIFRKYEKRTTMKF